MTGVSCDEYIVFNATFGEHWLDGVGVGGVSGFGTAVGVDYD